MAAEALPKYFDGYPRPLILGNTHNDGAKVKTGGNGDGLPLGGGGSPSEALRRFLDVHSMFNGLRERLTMSAADTERKRGGLSSSCRRARNLSPY